MSDINQKEGHECYTLGSPSTRDWFLRQWAIWPERADKDKTTNISFHYGALIACREDGNVEPTLSPQFRTNVEWFDNNQD